VTPTAVTQYGLGFPLCGDETPGFPCYDVTNPVSNDNPTLMQRFQFQGNFRALAAALFFHLLWNVQFQFYFGFMVLAGAVANWYFAGRDHKGNKIRGDPEHNELPYDPVWNSCKRTLRFHIGTIALASFIIAVIQFLRACLKYIEEKSNGNGRQKNGLQKCILSCLSCCLACAECCLDKISKNALIWTAIWGDSFFTAACSSFVLLWRNLAKVAALNAVADTLMFIGKITIALVTMAMCGWGLIHIPRWSTQIYSPIVPVIVIFILSYVVASFFMLVFEVAIDTTLLCFLVDCESHKHGGEMFASHGLQKLVAKHKKESEDMATEMNETRFAKIKAEDVADPNDPYPNGNGNGNNNGNGGYIGNGQHDVALSPYD